KASLEQEHPLLVCVAVPHYIWRIRRVPHIFYDFPVIPSLESGRGPRFHALGRAGKLRTRVHRSHAVASHVEHLGDGAAVWHSPTHGGVADGFFTGLVGCPGAALADHRLFFTLHHLDHRRFNDFLHHVLAAKRADQPPIDRLGQRHVDLLGFWLDQ